MENLDKVAFQFLEDGDLKDHWFQLDLAKRDLKLVNCFGVDFVKAKVKDVFEGENESEVLITYDEFLENSHLIVPKMLIASEDYSASTKSFAPGPRSVSKFREAVNYRNSSPDEFQDILDLYAQSSQVITTVRHMNRIVLGRSKGLCANMFD